MDRQAPAGLLGIHVNMPATVPEDVAKALKLIRIPLTSFGPSAYLVAPRREAAKGDLHSNFNARMFSFDSLGHIDVVVPDLEEATRVGVRGRTRRHWHRMKAVRELRRVRRHRQPAHLANPLRAP